MISAWTPIRIPLAVTLLYLLERAASDDQLIFVHAIFRHGTRSPIHVMPNDLLNPESSWRQGLGELQPEGMRQMYELGQMLRERYTKQFAFLSKKYKVNEIFFRSTDVNRTLTSALFTAAGLYEERDSFLSDWQPIPIHTWPKDLDQMLDASMCPRIHELDLELEKSAFVRSLQEKNKAFLHYLSSVSGFANLTPINVSSVFDNLRCQLATHGHSWPQWANSSIYDRTMALHRSLTIYQFEVFERVRIGAGLLLKDIADRLLQLPINTQNSGTRLKFYAYSAHDGNIILLLSALGFITRKEVRLPDFSGCLLLELWQNAQHGRFVKVLYRSNATEGFTEMWMDNCGRPCRLEVFDALIRRFVPDDWKLECGEKGQQVGKEVLKFLVASFSLIVFILLATVTILATLLYQRRSVKYTNYRPVDAAVLNRLLDDNLSDSEFSSLDIVDMTKYE